MSDWFETPESSNVARFRYIEADRVLSVEFKSGPTYNYYDVPEVVFEQMKAAGTKGQFLDQNVKGVYRYARA